MGRGVDFRVLSSGRLRMTRATATLYRIFYDGLLSRLPEHRTRLERGDDKDTDETRGSDVGHFTLLWPLAFSFWCSSFELPTRV